MRLTQLKFLILLILATISFTLYAEKEEPYIPYVSDKQLTERFDAIKYKQYGVIANDLLLDELMPLFQTPPISTTGKSLLTTNKMGFDVLDNLDSKKNWLLKEYSQFLSLKQKIILDVGCGYGNLVIAALSDNNTVIANDISVEHLIEVRRRALSQDLNPNKLYLNDQSFPEKTEFPKASLDAIMLHRVLHFLPPQEIEQGLAKLHDWLKPDGKLFIVVMSPQHKGFSSWFLPIYNRKWESGEKWPGVNLPVEHALPDQAYNLPEYLHVMDQRPLKLALEKYGFKIDKIDFIDMKHLGKPSENRDGNEAVGVIASKK